MQPKSRKIHVDLILALRGSQVYEDIDVPHYKEVGLDDVCFATKVTYKIDVDIYLRHSCSDRDFHN